MNQTDPGESDRDKPNAFADASEGKQVGIVQEFVDFVRETRKWWMIPILVVLLLVGLLVVLGGTGAAPFIYTLF